MKTAILCSGQGSQYVGMISDLYSKYDVVKNLVDEADKIVGYKLSGICFNGPMETLKETRFTQPALFLHSAVIFELIKDKMDFDVVAGHSVGEYAALYAAEVLSFKDALKLVARRGELMFEAGINQPGTMFAIIGLDEDKLVEVCDKLNENPAGNVVVPANYNCPGQIVVSGSRDFLREHAGKFKEAGCRMVKELVVSGAFHSPLMQAAQDELEKAINHTKFKTANKPVYANFSAKPLQDADDIKQALIEQLTAPVLWTQTIANMKQDKVTNFIEIGAGNVLQGLVKRTVEDVEIAGFDKAEDFDKL